MRIDYLRIILLRKFQFLKKFYFFYKMFIEVETVEMLFAFINKRMFHFQFRIIDFDSIFQLFYYKF